MMECSLHIHWQVETWTRTSTPLRWRNWTNKWLEWWIPTFSIGWVSILILIFKNILWKLIYVKRFKCRRRQWTAEHDAAVATRSGRRTRKFNGIWQITRSNISPFYYRNFFSKKYKSEAKIHFFFLVLYFYFQWFSFHMTRVSLLLWASVYHK